METSVHSRWDDAPVLDDKGKVRPLKFGDDDLEICKLLTPRARDPWGYRCLPTRYIALLTGRTYGAVYPRLTKLAKKPYSYLQMPEQPKNNYRERIFANAPNGFDEVRAAGIDVPRYRTRRLPHELMACIIAASFEYGAKKHGLVIDTNYDLQSDFYPDWPFFEIAGSRVWLEADTGSETISYSIDPDATTIGAKFDNYLKRIRDRQFRKTMAIFVTTREARMKSMIGVLKRAIDKHGYPYEYADHFAFTHINYDRFLNKIPPLTDWAVKNDYQRAGKTEPFNFLK